MPRYMYNMYPRPFYRPRVLWNASEKHTYNTSPGILLLLLWWILNFVYYFCHYILNHFYFHYQYYYCAFIFTCLSICVCVYIYIYTCWLTRASHAWIGMYVGVGIYVQGVQTCAILEFCQHTLICKCLLCCFLHIPNIANVFTCIILEREREKDRVSFTFSCTVRRIHHPISMEICVLVVYHLPQAVRSGWGPRRRTTSLRGRTSRGVEGRDEGMAG